MAKDNKIDIVKIFLIIFGFYAISGFFIGNGSIFVFLEQQKKLDKLHNELKESRKKYDASYNEMLLIDRHNNSFDEDYLDELARKKMNLKKKKEVLLKYKQHSSH